MAGADEEYQRALRLEPNSANAHHWYALYLSAMKRHDEAVEHINRALELDPLAIGIRYNAAWVYLTTGRSDEALEMAKSALDLDANNAPAHGTLAVVYESKGLYEEAIQEFRAAQKLRGGYSPYAVEIAHVYALEGRDERARALLRHLLSDPGWGETAPYSLAVTYAALGDKNTAFYWLKRSVEDHSCTANEINNDHAIDSLRSDPRFRQIERRANLSPG
jgi:tetratricopeptide (TPR) repeat protein